MKMTSSRWCTNCLLNVKFVLHIAWIFLYTIFYPICFIVRNIFPPKKAKLKDDEIILVTGGASGIGREICLQLGELNKSVTIISWDVNAKANDLLVDTLKARGVQKAYGFTVDVGDCVEVEANSKKIRQQIGHVTILVNNAGILGEVGPGWEMTPSVVQKVYDINVVSHCWTLRSFLPAMIERGSGHVVEVCSAAGFIKGPYISAYCASKHALKGYIECVKEDVRRIPSKPVIHFTMVYPSFVQTPLLNGVRFKTPYSILVPDMSSGFVAFKIICGMLHHEEHVYVPWYMRYGDALHSLTPPPVMRKIIDAMAFEMVVEK